MKTTTIGVTTLLAALACNWPASSAATSSAPLQQPLIGVSVPSKTAQVAAEQPGKLVSMPLQDGNRVEKDQVLFRLNSTLQELEVERLRPLAESEFVVKRAMANLEHAEREAQRVRDLQQQDIASDADLQKLEHEVTIAKLKLEQAQIEQQQSGNQLQQALEKLNQRSVTSPFDGTVTQRMKGEGESVERFVPVLEIMSFDPLWVEFDCPTHLINNYRPGTKVRVQPSQSNEPSREATVVFRSPKGNAASHTMMIRASLPNPDNHWGSGRKMLITPVEDGPADRVSAEPPPKPGK
ncbi:MAG: efflux RND transporter periplasmic adaptor subunit [bacterium]|nr:efflux RND transporter periplasmic adaptor subunit [bacterium]